MLNLDVDLFHTSLRTISEVLDRLLLGVLIDSLQKSHCNDLEPERLWRVSNSARDDAIRTLMDLHHRLLVKAPIPRLMEGMLGGARDATVQGTPDSFRVSHPAPPRQGITAQDAPNSHRVSYPPPPRPKVTAARQVPELAATSQMLVRRPPEDRAIAPFYAMNTSTGPQSTSSLALGSNFGDIDCQPETFASSSISARYRESVSSSLAVPMVIGSSVKTTADLLREWKDEINEKRLSMLSTAPAPRPPEVLGPSLAERNLPVTRHSSAPSTPSFRERPFPQGRESRSTHVLPRPGLQCNREGMAIDQRHRSDLYVPIVTGSPGVTSVPAPATGLQSGFTHYLPSKSAKASVEELLSGRKDAGERMS